VGKRGRRESKEYLSRRRNDSDRRVSDRRRNRIMKHSIVSG